MTDGAGHAARYNSLMLHEETPTVRCTGDALESLSVDLICVPCFEDEIAEALAALDIAVGHSISRARASGELTGKLHSLFLTDVVETKWSCRRVLLVGAGKADGYTASRASTVAATAGLAGRERGAGRLAFLCRESRETAAMIQAITEGMLLGSFRDTRFKSENVDSKLVTGVELVVGTGVLPVAREAAERGAILGECTNLARELSNEPGNLFTPRVFADRAIALASGPRTTVEVMDDTAIASQGMGLLQGVAQGSVEPARVIIMRYEPEEPVDGPVLGLVGKGVTFDTGGISIKPSEAMDRMKRDMAGGAAVVCAMRAIEQLRPPVRVFGIVPAVENMPGGGAIRPGDVLTAADGKRVEVLNTDAEGRLILADAMVVARRRGVTHLVDIATLTGACVVALGHHATGLVGTPPSWVERVCAVGARAGERLWPLPAYEDYADQLKSDTADLANIGGRAAGAITAGMFLHAFAGGLPWAHLDIAGTAWFEDSKPFHVKGASGVGVRTLAMLPFDASWYA